MIRIEQTGKFSKAYNFFSKLIDEKKLIKLLNKYGEKGVNILTSVTPRNTGLTASSWSYDIIQNGFPKNTISLTFNNSNIQDGVNVAIVLQYGHATINGGWVEGQNYINPALAPVFDELLEDVWEEVLNLL